MAHKHSILRTILFAMSLLLGAVLTACGSQESESFKDTQGIAVQSGAHAGMVLAAINADLSIRTSRIYYYEFDSGNVRELLPAESANPAVFAIGTEVLLFNRQADTPHTLRVLRPKNETTAAGEPITLSGLVAGDPLDVVPLSSSRVLLASAFGGKLQTLDYGTGALADVTPTNLASNALRAVALYRSTNAIYVAHSGITDLSGDATHVDNTQQLYVAQVTSAGDLAFSDQNPSTTVIDGLPLSASNPFSIVNRSADAATIVGVCAEGAIGCAAGADRLDGGTLKSSRVFDSSFGYTLLNRVVDGPDASTVYAHVKTSDGRYVIIKLNVQTQSAIVIHEFADALLYGLAYDATSRTLFVGGIDGIKGSMTLYRDDQLVGSFQLDGMPYHAAFVPK